MRILISAFSCMPGLGSEPGVGWGVVREAGLRHRVCVLTDCHNRRQVEDEIVVRALPGVHFIFVGLPGGYARVANVLCLGYLYYLVWQFWAYRVARRLHRKRPFNLVHHVTYCNSWAPSFMGWLGIPFVWCGGGKDVTPWRFYSTLSLGSQVAEARRWLAMKVLGAVTRYLTASHASVILSPSEARQWGSGLPVRRLLLGGLSETEGDAFRCLPTRSGEPFRIASIGRLQGHKGFGLGLMAFAALLKDVPEGEYLIVGGGSERRFLEKQASRLGCAEKVRFLDWMPRSSLLDVYSQFDVLLHPSFHEQFGYVVLEAMAAGRPVVCLAVGGCGQLVSGGGGTAVPLTTPKQVVEDLCRSLRELALDEERRLQTGRQARERAAKERRWGRVGERLTAVYEEASRGPVGCAGVPRATKALQESRTVRG